MIFNLFNLCIFCNIFCVISSVLRWDKDDRSMYYNITGQLLQGLWVPYELLISKCNDQTCCHKSSQGRRNRGGRCPRCPCCTGAHGGARGQRNALFCKTIHNCICIKTVIHKRRIDEVSAKEVAKEFVEINEQRRIYCGQFE